MPPPYRKEVGLSIGKGLMTLDHQMVEEMGQKVKLRQHSDTFLSHCSDGWWRKKARSFSRGRCRSVFHCRRRAFKSARWQCIAVFRSGGRTVSPTRARKESRRGRRSSSSFGGLGQFSLSLIYGPDQLFSQPNILQTRRLPFCPFLLRNSRWDGHVFPVHHKHLLHRLRLNPYAHFPSIFPRRYGTHMPHPRKFLSLLARDSKLVSST